MTCNKHPTSKQNTEINSLTPAEFALVVVFNCIAARRL